MVQNGNTWSTGWLVSQILYIKSQLPLLKFGFVVMILCNLKSRVGTAWVTLVTGLRPARQRNRGSIRGRWQDVFRISRVLTSSGTHPASYCVCVCRGPREEVGRVGEAYHSPVSKADMKNGWSHNSTPPYENLMFYIFRVAIICKI
jgi:hypothetical protein